MKAIAIVPVFKKQRKARGFSLKELKAANLNIKDAKKLKIQVDKRRKSAHEVNIKALKGLKK